MTRCWSLARGVLLLVVLFDVVVLLGFLQVAAGNGVTTLFRLLRGYVDVWQRELLSVAVVHHDLVDYSSKLVHILLLCLGRHSQLLFRQASLYCIYDLYLPCSELSESELASLRREGARRSGTGVPLWAGGLGREKKAGRLRNRLSEGSVSYFSDDLSAMKRESEVLSYVVPVSTVRDNLVLVVGGEMM